MSLKEQVMAKATFDANERDAKAIKCMVEYNVDGSENKFEPVFSGYCYGHDHENARMLPLLTLLIDVCEAADVYYRHSRPAHCDDLGEALENLRRGINE